MFKLGYLATLALSLTIGLAYAQQADFDRIQHQPESLPGSAQVPEKQPTIVGRGLTSESRLLMDRAIAPIKSADQLVEFLASTEPSQNPLSMLSEGGLKVFLGSLSFGPEGLASFNSSILENELSLTESYAVLELFGFQEAVSGLDTQNIQPDADEQIKFMGCSQKNRAKCDDGGGYVSGFCSGQGTCANNSDFTCHPPSCGG